MLPAGRTELACKTRNWNISSTWCQWGANYSSKMSTPFPLNLKAFISNMDSPSWPFCYCVWFVCTFCGASAVTFFKDPQSIRSFNQLYACTPVMETSSRLAFRSVLWTLTPVAWWLATSEWMVARGEQRHGRRETFHHRTQMSHETPGTCLWVGWENRWQRFWHGGTVMVWIVSQLLPADS